MVLQNETPYLLKASNSEKGSLCKKFRIPQICENKIKLIYLEKPSLKSMNL